MSVSNFTIAKLLTEVFIVEPNYANELLVQIEKGGDTHTAIANDSVTYQVVGDNAIIGLDGVMYKKDMSGACVDVVSYDQIISKIDMAEKDENVENIIFRVDTRGGSVAGAEEVRHRIKTSTKNTITFFENVGASGGMWIFTACNEVYASPMTQLGSIGVIVMYKDKESDTKAIVSSNAPNKYCDIANPECKTRIKAQLDEYENRFISVLIEAYPEKDSEQIIKDFDNGATIFSETALKLGYLDGVMQFTELLKAKGSNAQPMATMPSTKIVKNDKGMTMAEQNDVTIESLQAELAKRDTTIATLQADVDGGKEKIYAISAEVVELKEKVSLAESKLEVATYAVAKGMERKVSKEAIMEAMKAEDKLKAGDIIAEAMGSAESFSNESHRNANSSSEADAKSNEDALIAYSLENKIEG